MKNKFARNYDVRFRIATKKAVPGYGPGRLRLMAKILRDLDTVWLAAYGPRRKAAEDLRAFSHSWGSAYGPILKAYGLSLYNCEALTIAFRHQLQISCHRYTFSAFYFKSAYGPNGLPLVNGDLTRRNFSDFRQGHR